MRGAFLSSQSPSPAARWGAPPPTHSVPLWPRESGAGVCRLQGPLAWSRTAGTSPAWSPWDKATQARAVGFFQTAPGTGVLRSLCLTARLRGWARGFLGRSGGPWFHVSALGSSCHVALEARGPREGEERRGHLRPWRRASSLPWLSQPTPSHRGQAPRGRPRLSWGESEAQVRGFPPEGGVAPHAGTAAAGWPSQPSGGGFGSALVDSGQCVTSRSLGVPIYRLKNSRQRCFTERRDIPRQRPVRGSFSSESLPLTFLLLASRLRGLS